MKPVVQNLTETVIKNYPDFHRRPDLDFHDDGNNFKGFDYKGLPITTLRSSGSTYLSIRYDYYSQAGLKAPYSMIPDTMRELAWEWNGTSDGIEMQKLIDNCEKIISMIAEINTRFEAMEVDVNPLYARLAIEKAWCKDVFEYGKTFPFWEVGYKDSFYLKQTSEAVRQIKNYINRIESYEAQLHSGNYSKAEAMEHLNSVARGNYIFTDVGDGNIWYREIKEGFDRIASSKTN